MVRMNGVVYILCSNLFTRRLNLVFGDDEYLYDNWFSLLKYCSKYWRDCFGSIYNKIELFLTLELSNGFLSISSFTKFLLVSLQTFFVRVALTMVLNVINIVLALRWSHLRNLIYKCSSYDEPNALNLFLVFSPPINSSTSCFEPHT